MQYTCKNMKITCFYAASTSHRMHAIASNKVRTSKVTPPAGCRIFYLQFAGEFTRGLIADCLKLRVFLPAIVSIFDCDCGYFYLQSRGFLPAVSGILACVCNFFPAITVFFACKSRKFCMSGARKFA